MTTPQGDPPPGHTMSQAGVRRLILSKQLYNHALEHYLKPGPIDKMIAVHNFHNSVEIFIRTVAMEYRVTKAGHNIGIPDLVKEIKAVSGIELPYMQHIYDLSTWRNLAQHAATIAQEPMLDEWRQLARSFLKDSCFLCFGKSIDDVTSAMLIVNTQLRALLIRAEMICTGIADAPPTQTKDESDALYRQHQYALAALSITFAFTFGLARDCSPYSVATETVAAPAELTALRDRKVIDALWPRIRNLELASFFPLLGIDYWAYQELAHHAPSILLDESSSPWLEATNDLDADPQLLRRLIDAQVNAILSMEAHGWIPETTRIEPIPYLLAAQALENGRHLPIAGMDGHPTPAASATLHILIRNGFPEFRQVVAYL